MLVVVCLCACWPKDLSAQSDPLYSQYQFNMLAINPAYAGSRDLMSLLMLSRNQWVGFAGAPVTQSFTAHTPLYTAYTSAGLSITRDKIGPMSQTLMFADYAFRFNISSQTKLSLGLKAGFNSIRIDYNSLERTPGSNDPAYDEGVMTKLMPNFGFGAYLSHPAYYFGFAVPRLVENDFADDNGGNALLSGHESRNYFVMAGGIFSINSDFKLRPSLLARIAEASPVTTDINVNLIYADKLWTGVMLRPKSAWGAVLQYQFIPQLKVGYAIEFTTNELQNVSNGTHEFMLLYEFHFKKQKVYSPRYF